MELGAGGAGGDARPRPNIRRKGGKKKTLSDSVTVRQDFPETWLWAAEETE